MEDMLAIKWRGVLLGASAVCFTAAIIYSWLPGRRTDRVAFLLPGVGFLLASKAFT